MNQLSMGIKQNERAVEENWCDELVVESGDCPLNVVIAIKNQTPRTYKLNSISKQRAIMEANKIVKGEICVQDSSAIWCIPGVLDWQIAPVNHFSNRIAKKQTWWNRCLNYFFEV